MLISNPQLTQKHFIRDKEDQEELELYDAQGRSLRQFVIKPGENFLDLNEFAEGLYFLNCRSAGTTEKLVIRR